MGKSIYGQTSGPDHKGQGFQTQAWTVELTASLASGSAMITTLKAIETAALTLETAVSTSMVAVVTGILGAPGVTTLSASYSSVTASIY